MKIALVSRGRTCSTAIGQSLAKTYNCGYFNESYLTIHEKIQSWYGNKKNSNLKKSKVHFEKLLTKHTAYLFSHERFVSKFFPSTLAFPPPKMSDNDTFDSIKEKFIFKLDVLNIQSYDHIYFLDRNFYDSIISWVYAVKSLKFHRVVNNNLPYPTITVDTKDFAIAKFYMVEYFLQKNLRLYLLDKNIPTTFIDDLNCDNYINNSILKTTKTNVNYCNHITNIAELNEFIDKWYPICQDETKDWNFY